MRVYDEPVFDPSRDAWNCDLNGDFIAIPGGIPVPEANEIQTG
ncbi:hypothetical protein GCM10011403_02600 [Pseudohongiella nitratireducens]|uniref:Uncharacterized protein n=1 Tax=Pseudohongiella nitratireducens TaxID=1768907 RepID=A0A917LQD1_9GAMM|nr:hypothetical protein GCM10011403_02600 [Pseudohongiella nitratireducens]